MSLERLVDAINEIYPDIHLNAADYSSYIIKNISASDCSFSIRNQGSNQYHIAITGVERMSIFPLITDYKYLSTHDTQFKHKFTFKCPLRLYLPNLIAKANWIVGNYTELAATHTRLKEELTFYEQLRDEMTAEARAVSYKRTSCNMTYNERGSGQKQHEIGRSDDDSYFMLFRKLIFPNDKMIILKRAIQVEYLFIILTEDIFQAHHLNEIAEVVEIPTTERISLATLASATDEAALTPPPEGEDPAPPDETPPPEEETPAPATEYVAVPMMPEQVIFFGAPGTGKSYDIDTKISALYPDAEVRKAHIVRVTFYPDYEYSDFVGALRPVRHSTRGLDYEFIPGPMTRILAECFKKPAEKFFIIIEEINRGNAPAIFGDLFQLLDRTSNGRSRYEIDNEEIAGSLQKETQYLNVFNKNKTWFPSNLNILCSMNTADQNVFVLDTAFSRRFERVYVKINFNRLDDLVGDKKDKYTGAIPIFAGTQSLMDVFRETDLKDFAEELEAAGKLTRSWPTFALLVNKLIDVINGLGGTDQISEDKKLGPFFVSETDLSSREAFLDKVVYYLKQDVFRYVEQYFESPFQTIYDKYSVAGADLFALLKVEA